MRNKKMIAFLLSIIMIMNCSFLSASAVTDFDISTNKESSVQFHLAESGDIVAEINFAEIEDGEPFGGTFSIWVDENGNIYEESDLPAIRSARGIGRIDFNYSALKSSYRIYNQSWSVKCTEPYLKLVTGDVDYIVNDDTVGDDRLASEPLSGLSAVHGGYMIFFSLTAIRSLLPSE